MNDREITMLVNSLVDRDEWDAVECIRSLKSRLESLEKDAELMVDALKDALCSLEISRQSDYVTSKVRKAIDTAMQANKGE